MNSRRCFLVKSWSLGFVWGLLMDWFWMCWVSGVCFLLRDKFFVLCIVWRVICLRFLFWSSFCCLCCYLGFC